MFKKKEEISEKSFSEEFGEELKANRRKLVFDISSVIAVYILKTAIKSLEVVTEKEV